MSLWNPYAFNVFGDPLPPAAPPALRVYGGEATAGQLSSAQGVFAVFSEGMRMSYVPNPTELGRLPDGSIYRITVVGNTATMEMWVAPAFAPTETYAVFGGVLRMVGGETVETPSGPISMYKEFKGNGENSYSRTTKLFAVPGNSGLGDLVWRTFEPMNLSGPAAKLAQFGRACTAAYTSYYASKMMPLERSIGDGVVIFDDGATKKAFCYGHPRDGAVRAIPMTIAPLADFPGLKLPAEIKALFGGVPIPPSVQGWNYSSVALFTDAQLRSLIGSGPTNVLQNAQLFFPVYATAGDGGVAHFISGYLDRTGKPSDSRDWTRYGALVRMDLNFGESGLSATLSLAQKGAVNHTLAEADLPLGETTGPIGVTHVSGQLTVFSRRMSIRKWKFKIAAGGGAEEQTKLVKAETIWPGGSVVTYYLPGLSSYQGSFSGSRKISSVGNSSEKKPNGDVETYSLWVTTANFSGSFQGAYPGSDNLGSVDTPGAEGSFIVTKRKHNGFISTGYSASGSYTSPVYKHLTGVSGSWGSNSFPDINPATYFIDYSSSTVFFGDVAAGMVGLAWMLPSRPDKNPWDTFSVTALSTPETAEYVSTTIYSGGRQFEIDAMEVLREYEAPDYVSRLEKDGKSFGYNDPLQFIRNRDGRTGEAAFNIVASQLGGSQVVAKLYAYSMKHGTEHSYSQCRGSLVDTAFDNAYDARVDVTFVGELQP